MVNKYKNLLEYKYGFEKKVHLDLVDAELSKLEYLGESIFGFTTYYSKIAETMAQNMLDVINAINIGATRDYIAISDEAELNYYMMVNMEFLANKIDWGISIMYPFFDGSNEYKIDGSTPYYGDRDLTITINKGEIKSFAIALTEWVKDGK